MIGNSRQISVGMARNLYAVRRSGAAARMGAGEWAPLAIALAMRLASGPTANLSYLVLAAYALLGPAHVIRALALSWFFSMVSPGISPEASAAAVGRYAVLFAGAASAMLHGNALLGQLRVRPFTLATLLLGAFIVLHSIFISPIKDVSALKAISWTLAMTTLISVWGILPPAQRDGVAQQIFWGLVATLILSLPLTATSLGYLRNGSGFQGILNHPQALGPTMALLCAWAVTRLLGESRPPWWLLAIAGASLVCILLSEARTAGLATALAVMLAVACGPAFAGRSIRQMFPGLRSARIWAIVGLSLIAGIALAPVIASTLHHYITKSGRAQLGGVEVGSLLQAYDRSRGRLMDMMLDNIAEHPITGIGFGIASHPELMEIKRDPVLGLPIGASIEKGVMPLMVVEELGIAGAVIIGLWVLSLLRSGARGGVAPLAICFTILLLNFGEATLFSPGGVGLISLILLGWVHASAVEPGVRRG